MNRLKTLWIVPKWPYPATDGARQATLALLGSVAAGLEIDIAVFTDDKRESEANRRIANKNTNKEAKLLESLGVRNISFLQKGSPLRSKVIALLSGRPATLEAFAHAPPETLRGYEVVVFDGLHAATSFLGHAKPAGQAWVYRSHNVESDLWLQAARSDEYPRAFRAILGSQGRKVREVEKKLLEASDLTAVISREDEARYRELLLLESSESARIEWIPFSLPRPASTPAFPPPSPHPVIGFLGKMDWAPNRQGLEWFLENVWPEARRQRPELRLKVAGSGDDRWLRALAEGDAGIELLGRVDQPEDLFLPCWLNIAPIQFGSGTRIKVVEAARFARATLGTKVGMQGSGLSDSASAYVLDRPQDWIAQLVKLDHAECKTKGLRSFELFLSELTASSTGARFLHALTGLKKITP